MENKTIQPLMLNDIINTLAVNCLQMELKTGYKDAVNNYGWHVEYFVKVFETVEFCSKCREKLNINYSDESHPFNNHKHEHELKLIFSNHYTNDQDLCNGLLSVIELVSINN